MVVMYGGWHWFLFESYYSDVMKKKKFHPKVPGTCSYELARNACVFVCGL